MNFDAAYSFGSYEGALRDLIHLFKYAKVESLAGPFGRMMLSVAPPDAKFDLVIAMPMHWRKRWERGFNQAELLAAPLAHAYGVRLSRCLRRTRYTKAQASLGQEQRLANLDHSFAVRGRNAVSGKSVLLIDDVFTTGATLRAATAVLKDAGASHVSAMTLARADQRRFEGDVKSGYKPGARVARAGSGGALDSVVRRNSS